MAQVCSLDRGSKADSLDGTRRQGPDIRGRSGSGLLPWRALTGRLRRRLLNRWANDLLRAIAGTTAGEAFAFIQFPVHPLVKQADGDTARLLRLQPRVFHAADFDHSPYFDIIKAPYLLDAIPGGFGAVPWKGNAGALTPEQRRPHLSVVD